MLPLWMRAMPSNDQPPISRFMLRLTPLAKCLPWPNGSSYVQLNFRLCFGRLCAVPVRTDAHRDVLRRFLPDDVLVAALDEQPAAHAAAHFDLRRVVVRHQLVFRPPRHPHAPADGGIHVEEVGRQPRGETVGAHRRVGEHRRGETARVRVGRHQVAEIGRAGVVRRACRWCCSCCPCRTPGRSAAGTAREGPGRRSCWQSSRRPPCHPTRGCTSSR